MAVCSFDVTGNLPRVGKVAALQSSRRGTRGPDSVSFSSASGEERAAFAFLSFRERPESAGSAAAAGLSSSNGDDGGDIGLKWRACRFLHLCHKIFHSGKKGGK